MDSIPLHYDVFNGDADGICALHQWRLSQPASHHLITGVKRDIELLRRVPGGAGSKVLVLDISLDTNLGELRRLLDGGAQVTYFDHHLADQAFAHPGLQLHCDSAPNVCTSMLVDRHLQGRYRRWAVVAAFGDNLPQPAWALARSIGLDDATTAALEQLGQVINYNAYGECEADLHIAPAALYRALHGCENPCDFIGGELYRTLHQGYRDDCAQLQDLRPYWQQPGRAIYLLPGTPWSRRISGVLANRLATQGEGSSFAVLDARSDGGYMVSVRSGDPETRSACGLCQQFVSGGGRKAAAGINRLAPSELERFIERFGQYFAPSGPLRHAS